MRSKILIRCGIASLLIGGGVGGLFAAGCGSSSSGTTPSGDDAGDDGSTQPGDDATTTDGGGTKPGADGGADADAGPAVVHGKLILVHASSYAPSLRFCFGLSAPGSDAATDLSTVAKKFPAPNNVLGVPPGTGGVAADTDPNTDLKDANVTIFGISANALLSQVPTDGGAELDCSKLVGSAALAADAGGLGLVEGIDYWNLGTLPAGTLADGTTTLVAVTGCAPGNMDTNDQALLCPTGYSPGTGNLGLATAKLDTSTALDGGSLGAQVTYASYPFSQYAKLNGGTGAAAAGFFVSSLVVADAGVVDSGATDAGDGGDAAPVDAGPPVLVPFTSFIPVAAPIAYGQTLPTSLVPVSGLTFDGTTGVAFKAFAADGGANGASVALPLPAIQALSYPGAPQAEFANGVGYVFVLVGTPGQPSFVGSDGGAVPAGDAGTFNPLSLHILGFPVNPPFGN